MSIIQWNLRSIHGNREQIRLLFHESNACAICLQETKLGYDQFQVGHNFVFYRSPPFVGVRAQGGTAIIIKKSMNQKVIELNTVLQACAVQI